MIDDEEKRLFKFRQKIFKMYVNDYLLQITPQDAMFEEDCSDFLSFNQFVEDKEVYNKYYQIYMRGNKLKRILK